MFKAKGLIIQLVDTSNISQRKHHPTHQTKYIDS